jgi:uncharacterized membrane protein YfcA
MNQLRAMPAIADLPNDGLCSIPASKLGVFLAGLIPVDRLRKAFGLLMVGLAIKTAAVMVL